MSKFKRIKYLFKLIFKVSPSFIFLNIIGSLFSAIQIIGNVILPKYLIDELITNKNFENALFYGIITVLFNLLINFIKHTYYRVLEVKQTYVAHKVMEQMSVKIMKVEYRYLEDPYYLDLKERAIFACNNQGALQRVINGISGVISNIITLAGLIAIMFTLGYILITILFVGMVIAILLNRWFMKYQVGFFQNLIPINRKYGYYFHLTNNEKLNKDMRLYNMSPLILNREQHYNKINISNFAKFFKTMGVVNGIESFLTSLQTGIVYFYVAFMVFASKTKITLGLFTMYASSAISFTKTFDSLFRNLTDMKQVLDYLDPFVEFMQLPDASKGSSRVLLQKVEKIEFKNVSFTYPKTDNLILDNVSFTINKGDKISIVGLNGAGKTTIIKLICRFYNPDSGSILINDIDINEYDYKSYLNELAIVFQDFKLFAYSISKNITGEDDIASNELNPILNKVGLTEKIKELPKGINTSLNKSFVDDGVELSGGQGQKVAIARALYKNSSLVILDEPTSALDPIAEAEIYEHFNELVLDNTAIYISHRMSSSVFCDYILVLDGGKVVAFDTHSNLMKDTSSLYYKLFKTQSENYQLD